MAKSKSSASSATRKKHANKKQPEENEESSSQQQQSQQRGQKKVKKSRFEPKIKSYIPPPAPPKGLPDPIELYLIQSTINPELIIILRKLMKRDEATISKGVEGLELWTRDLMKLELEIEKNNGKTDGSEEERDDEEELWKLDTKRDELVNCMNVWAHHFPRLALHPSRRLRLQSLTLNTLLSSSPSSHRPSKLLTQTRSVLLSPQWIESKDYIGTWCCSSFDSDRAVKSIAKRGWENVVLLPSITTSTSTSLGKEVEVEGISLEESKEMIMEFAIEQILYKNQSLDENSDDDPSARKTQALLTISYLLSTLPTLSSSLSTNSIEFFNSLELWELVRPEESSALRRAVYDLLGTIVDLKEVNILSSEGIQIISGRILRYCWGEEDSWAGIISFLRRYPEAWTLADLPIISLRPTPQISEDSDESDDEEEDDDVEDSAPISTTPSITETSSTISFTPSSTLSLFLSHLSSACSSHPTLYPTVLLLLATIPTSVLPPTYSNLNIHLFESGFWGAWGGRGLGVGMLTTPGGNGGNIGGGITAVEEWIGSLLECLNWEVGAMNQLEEEGEEKLIERWIGKVWRVYLGFEDEEEGEDGIKNKGTKGINTRKVAKLLEGTLSKFGNRKESLFKNGWSSIQVSSTSLLQDVTNSNSLVYLSNALNIFNLSNSELLVKETKELIKELVKMSILNIINSQDVGFSSNNFNFIEAVRSIVYEDAELTQDLNSFAISHGATLLSSPSSTNPTLTFLSTQISSLSDTTSINSIWSSLFVHALPSSALLKLIEAVQTGNLKEDKLESAGLDNGLMEMCLRVIGNNQGDSTLEEEELKIVEKLCIKPHPFVNPDTPALLIALVTFRLQELTFTLPISSPTSLRSSIRLIKQYTQVPENALNLIAAEAGIIEVFEVAEGLISSGGIGNEDARIAWKQLAAVGGQVLAEKTMDKIRRHLLDTASLASTAEIVHAAAALIASLPSSIQLTLASLLPSISAFDSLYTSLRLSSPSSALSILDSLIQPSSSDDDDTPINLHHHDSTGLNSYARAVLAILEISARDHSWTRNNIWILPHVLLLGNVARDELALQNSTSGMFNKSIETELLQSIVTSTDGLTSYVLSFVANGLLSDWQGTTIAILRAKLPPVEVTYDLVGILDGLARKGRNSDDVYSRRGFSTILKATLKYTEASLQDADRWLAFAQGLTEGSELACAIITSIKSILFETPRFERYQNELASTLAGIPSSAASERGVRVLRTLLATAPPLDAPIIFLPQQRTMFLIQRMQVWISSDDDLVDEIHTMIAELFLHLAPIVQELSGSHWDLIFDIIESNLETADWTDQTSLPALYHSARLLEQIKDLASSNAELRVTAKGRIDKSLELVRNLFVSRPTTTERNQPRAIILESLARLVRDLPPKLLTMGSSFDQLLRLLQDPSMAVQHSSFSLVSRIADQYLMALVVLVELDVEDEIGTILLPLELVKLVQNKLPSDLMNFEGEYHKASTYLLAWLIIFTFFEKASPRIKSAYIDQLRQADTIAVSFLPSIFSLVGLSDRSRPFDMSPWVIDEFRLDLIDEVTPLTLSVLASYTYYKSLQALPSLIRQWWESCKNRQLSMAVHSMTSKYFSPVLIASELAHLRDPEDPAGKALRDNEDFTVKVAGGANEVKAVFVVDEQNMEILIRLPNEFPLMGIEVKDIRRVGVTDGQWRAWLLAVQQVVSGQNSTITDGLNLFKKNVSLHFDGVEACAICYSIIHVIDRSLPSKECHTCHNRFHGACLYKWFSTSHSSTCPMCRGTNF